MMTAGAPPRGDDDIPDHPATQPGAVYDGENNCAPMLTARHGNGLPGSYTDTLDQLHRVPVWPGPQLPTAKALRRRRIRETLPEIGIVTLILVILGGLLAAAVLMTATGTVYDHAHHHGHDPNRHDARITAFCITLEDPLDWQGVAMWLEMLVASRGENLLRVKGILNVKGHDRPVAIHAVRHLMHPPVN